MNASLAEECINQRPTTSQPSSSKSVDKKRSLSAVKRWRQLAWSAWPSFQTDGEGHADLILDCDLDLVAGVVLTACRDTTLKVRSQFLPYLNPDYLYSNGS
jgi:hypothetical protein